MSSIKLFEEKKVRRYWDSEKEQCYFSVNDEIEILTDSTIPKRYWSDLKKKLTKEGSGLYEKIVQLKLESSDGKKCATDCLDTPDLLRLIRSIASPKAEPFKQWLAKVGCERMQKIADPAQSLDRACENWIKLGRSEKWIQQRMTGQETRNKLTDYWKQSGVEKNDKFDFLTSIIHQERSELTVKQHKNLKGLEGQYLRDHMSEAELIFTALPELSTWQIAGTEKSKGVPENAVAGKWVVKKMHAWHCKKKQAKKWSPAKASYLCQKTRSKLEAMNNPHDFAKHTL